MRVHQSPRDDHLPAGAETTKEEIMRFPRLRKPKKQQLTGKVYTPRLGWGDSIYFMNYPERRIVGWQARMPGVADEVQVLMKSGQTARFGILSVEPCADPADMFFAIVGDIGYLGEPILEDSPFEEAGQQCEVKGEGVVFGTHRGEA